MIKTGVDLLLNSRLEENIKDPEFLKKVFQISELKYKDNLKSIFALKEATMKAIGKKIGWKSIEISYKDSRPIIILSQDIKPENFKSINGSISHDGEYTIGFVVMELEDK